MQGYDHRSRLQIPDGIFFIKLLVKYVLLGNRIWGTPQTWWAAWTNPFCRSGTYSTCINVYCTIIVNNRQVIIFSIGLGKYFLLPWYKSDLSVVKRSGFWVEIGHLWVTVTLGEHLHRKKRFTSFPSPGWMSLTKLPLRGYAQSFYLAQKSNQNT